VSLAVLYSRALSGMEAALVTVEVHIANGLPNFTILCTFKPNMIYY
jgi:magnesium chelatase family protein